MIAIVNVDTIPRSSGPHIYELRINKEVIATFTHNREDSLEKCLQLASQAAAKAKVMRIDQYLDMFNA